MLPPGRWALTPPFHPCQMRSTERGQPPVLPKAGRRGAKLTGGLIFCGTFRSRVTSQALAQLAAQPPGVTRRVALSWPTLASSPRPESGLSSRSDLSRGPAIAQLIRQPNHYSPAPQSVFVAVPCYDLTSTLEIDELQLTAIDLCGYVYLREDRRASIRRLFSLLLAGGLAPLRSPKRELLDHR